MIGRILVWGVLLALFLGPVDIPAVDGVDRVMVAKAERRLHLCRGDSILKTYGIALGRAPTGHKAREGDSRTPEGRYVLDWRNADSRYHLSIHISYPNRTDRENASAMGVDPGGDIMIHGYPAGAGASLWSRYWFLGRDWTDGCIAVSNADMKEIWDSVPDGTAIDILP